MTTKRKVILFLESIPFSYRIRFPFSFPYLSLFMFKHVFLLLTCMCSSFPHIYHIAGAYSWTWFILSCSWTWLILSSLKVYSEYCQVINFPLFSDDKYAPSLHMFSIIKHYNQQTKTTSSFWHIKNRHKDKIQNLNKWMNKI